YTREKLNEPKESVFECYESFIKKYPKSKWADNAKANLVSLGADLKASGKSGYAEKVESFKDEEDDDIKLTALNALGNMGNDKAYQTVVDIFDHAKSDKLR